MGTTDSPISFSVVGGILLARIDNPPVNALSQPVRAGLQEAVRRVQDDDALNALLILCSGRTFIAGADVREFGKPPLEPHLPQVIEQIDACSKPVIAALFGTTLGGGLEVAMSAHYRIALAGSKVGLPEVNLGLLPGAGGTQLLPRLIGVNAALEMMTSGKPRGIEAFADTLLIDRIVDSNLDNQALVFAQEILQQQLGTRSTIAMPVALSIESPIDSTKDSPNPEASPEPGVAKALFDDWRARIGKKARGQMAPTYIVDAVEKSISVPYAEAQAFAREKFIECRDSSQSRAMRHAFFAEREAGKTPGSTTRGSCDSIREVGVIGAGTMGAGIAICFANAGFQVRMLELNNDNLTRGLQSIRDNYEKTRAREILSAAQVEAAIARITGSTDYVDLANADLVVEAAFESLPVKQDIFARLDQTCKPATILATNTSYLDINQIAAATNRPAKVLGLHFFSPANVMKLLEVVNAAETAADTLSTAMALGKKIGKIAVAVGHCYGFVGNRMYACYGREAQRLLLDGASPRQIDQAMRDWGMAMGPLAVLDMSGIDIGYRARQENRQRFAHDPLYFRAADMLAESGRLGRKTGCGFYSYQNGSQEDDPEVLQLIAAEAQRLGVQQRSDISQAEIQHRLILALINEGAHILDEGIARRASDIDVIWLNGYGFPRFRGGPMCYADELGLDEVISKIQAFNDQTDDQTDAQSDSSNWQPASLLGKLQSQGHSLSEYIRTGAD